MKEAFSRAAAAIMRFGQAMEGLARDRSEQRVGIARRRSSFKGARRIPINQRSDVDGKLVSVTGRGRGDARLVSGTLAMREAQERNWRRSSVGRANARWRRRQKDRAPLQRAVDIREALRLRREIRDLRRLARRGFALGEFCPVHDLGLEAPYRCDCPESVLASPERK